jgi:gamma-glutamyltranspeptidase/glutathione hydrolase
VAAWHELAERWGTRPLSGALRRAAALAADGVPVAPGLARDLDRERDRVLADPGMRAVFTRDGEVLSTGDTLQQIRLGATLGDIADGGPDAFYRSDVTRTIVRTLAERGAPMREEDFADHRTWVGEPISTVYAGEEYVTAPPACQGAFFLEALAALEQVRGALGRDLDPLGEDAGWVATVLEAAASDRDAMLGDRDVAPLDLEELLTARATEVAQAALDPSRGLAVAQVRATGDTVAIVATDASGTWVSLIQSLFHAFGSGVLDPASGVLLHNRGASFSLEPGSPNGYAGGRRPLHTLMPVLVRRDGRLVGAHGTMGGRAQPQIHTQIALNLARGASVQEAVARPRWILGAMAAGASADRQTVVNVEQDVPDLARRQLAERFDVEVLPPHDDGTGHSQLVRRTADGIVAATDPRADGAAHVGQAADLRRSATKRSRADGY